MVKTKCVFLIRSQLHMHGEKVGKGCYSSFLGGEKGFTDFCLTSLYFIIFKKTFRLHQMAYGVLVPNQESNMCPLRWYHGVLATGPPEKSCIL